MPRLQLLVATMNLTDIIGLCDEMHIASDALIINQADSVKYEYVFYHGYKIECYTFAERGLSRSRNNALLRCTGDILCILPLFGRSRRISGSSQKTLMRPS